MGGGDGLIEIKPTQPATWRWSLVGLGKNMRQTTSVKGNNFFANHSMIHIETNRNLVTDFK